MIGMSYLVSSAGPTEFTIVDLQACRYIVGMRLHALIFACQAAIPFLSLSYQPKNEGFAGLRDARTVVGYFQPALLRKP